MKKVLILGATSAIAQHVARLLAAKGAALYLVGRNAAQLEAVRQDVTTRGASRADVFAVDLNDVTQHEALVARAEAALGGLSAVLLAHGLLGNQAESEQRFEAAQEVLLTNFNGAVSLLTVVANRFEAQRSGTVIAVSSVAGDRGRQSNYVYGAAKAGLSAYLQGLRNRLHRSGVRVLTVKPGFVDTPMVAHLKKNALFASPEQVARGIVRAAERGKDVVYLPGFWAPIMWLIRAVPESLFKRLRL